jgi:glycosyltransferase involved in cell wall biosynthesis
MVFSESGVASKIKTVQILVSLVMANHIVCVSAKTAAELEQRYPRLSRKSIVIENPVADIFLSAEPCDRNVRYRALYVGKRIGFKNFSDAKWLLGDHKYLSLYVVGPPPNRDELRAYEEHIQTERLIFLGEVDDAHYVSHLTRSDFLFMPSRDEGFGLPFIEAGACGIPVVSRLDGHFLRLEHNHILHYATREQLRCRVEEALKFPLGKRVSVHREVSRRFSAKECAAKYLRLANHEY